jgi:hypothetical protein
VSGIQAFDFSVDVLRGLLWQHNRATKLRALLEAKQAWFDTNHTAFWTDWLHDVFDLRTANAFGCQVWARILGIRLAPPPNGTAGPAWGFGEFHENFDNAPFATSGPESVQLTVEQQRIVLRLRWYQLTIRPSVTEINRMLADVFSDLGLVYVLDPRDMSDITYVFTFVPDPRLVFVLTEFDILPRSSTIGVQLTTTAREAWGFGPDRQNFDNAPFGNPQL